MDIDIERIDESSSPCEETGASYIDKVLSPTINVDNDIDNTASSTAKSILNILQQISISPPESSSNEPPYPYVIFPNNRSTLQHLHSLPKSIIPKRKLSSSSSFDGYTNNINDTNTNNSANIHKKQLVYLRDNNCTHNSNSLSIRKIATPSPLSRTFLISRLNTFSVFNWTIDNPKLSPLLCATQGWRCHSSRKNELYCTSCHSGIIVKLPEIPDNYYNNNTKNKVFNNLHHADNYDQILNNTEKYELPYDFEYIDDSESETEEDNDDVHIYETLINSYVNRLTTDHYPICKFLPFLPLSPKDENYPITRKDMSREISKFYKRLNNFKINKFKLNNKNFKFSLKFLTFDEIKFFIEFLKQQEEDNDEIEIDIDTGIDNSLDILLPGLLGWELKIQKFHNDKFLLLKCEYCTRRILISRYTTTDSSRENESIEELKPCPHRAEIPAREQFTEFDDNGIKFDVDDEDEENIDLEEEHDNWCCMKQGWRIVLEGLRSYSDIDLKRPTSGSSGFNDYQHSMDQLRML